MDEFNFGPPGRNRQQIGIDPRLLMVVGGLLVVALAVFGFLTFVSKGGHEVAEAQVTAVQQIDHSQDAVAQSTLRNAMAAAKTLFTDNETYDGLGAADLAGVEPSLTYTDGPSPNAQTVSVAMQGSVAGLAAMSPSGTCFYIKDDAVGGVTFGSGTVCTGQAALGAATGASW
jgi:type IV pilus assembly protein PilA